ncbi:hypothetical protein B0H14DRAFT_2596945 [Mycena olivaceomarginata]|nr:hypothetical protein B0H14DRAFT_2596945 [Mycena olivaceomarginata]
MTDSLEVGRRTDARTRSLVSGLRPDHQAEDTIFRVSGTILAVQSTVFWGMLSLPTLEAADMVDGCPFVLLRTLQRTPVIFSRGVLPRPGMPARAACRWTSFRSRASSVSEWIRPTSFYRICQSSFDREIVTGTELSDADKVTCIKGLHYLETTGAARVLDFLLASYGRCAISTQCMEARQNMHREVETKRRRYDAESFTAMPLELYAEDPADVCLGCVSDVKMLHDEAREELWEDLPRIIGLGDWQKLEAMKAEAPK